MVYITPQCSELLQAVAGILMLYLMYSIIYTVVYLGKAFPVGKVGIVVIIALMTMTVKPEKVEDNKFEVNVQKDITIKLETIKPTIKP